MSILSTTKDEWLCKEPAESGAGDQTVRDIAWHVSRQMLARKPNRCAMPQEGRTVFAICLPSDSCCDPPTTALHDPRAHDGRCAALRKRIAVFTRPYELT